MNKKVCIVIVNYNGEKFQNDALRSLKKMKNNYYDILIVDNNSSDNSLKMVENEFEDVKIIKCGENYGVAKGNNIGIKYSIENDYEYTLLLNNDVEVHEDMLDKLLMYADKNTITVPKIYYYEPNNVIWYAGGYFDWKHGTAYHIGIHEEETNRYNDILQVQYSPTCCMLISNNIFNEIGLMDENYFMYYDDTDFCARAYYGNVKILYVPESFLWHKVSSSSGGEDSKTTVYYCNRNKFYFMKKNSNKIKRLTYLLVVAKDIAKYILSPIRKKNDKYILKADMDYRNGRMGKCNNL